MGGVKTSLRIVPAVCVFGRGSYLCNACFRPSWCFFTLFGFFCGAGGVPRGRGHNLLMQFSSLGSSNMEISETECFYMATIHNDQISYVKHVLDPIHVLFTLIGVFGRGQGARAQPAYAIFHSRQLKNGIFQKRFI